MASVLFVNLATREFFSKKHITSQPALRWEVLVRDRKKIAYTASEEELSLSSRKTGSY